MIVKTYNINGAQVDIDDSCIRSPEEIEIILQQIAAFWKSVCIENEKKRLEKQEENKIE